MWAFIHTYFPTLSVAAVGGTVGAGVYWLIQEFTGHRLARNLEDYRHQNALRAQREKTRLDLYNRRFDIFSSIFDYYDAIVFWEGDGTVEQRAARTRFFRAYQESRFLFSKESGVEDILKLLNDAGNKVIGFKQHIERYRSDPATLNKLHMESMDIESKVFTKKLDELKTAMADYLTFPDQKP